MIKRTRYKAFLDHFTNQQLPIPTELNYGTPFQLLVAVILSAQCTDQRVNSVTPALFSRFPSPRVLGESTFGDVFPYVKSISYPNNKTKHIIGAAKMLVTHFNGIIPEDEIILQKLPGVGRKTAHVLAAVLYNKPTLAVDTHVFRVAKRLGLAKPQAATPLAVEKELTQHIPKKHIVYVNQWLVLHGRYICKARKPQCDRCPLTSFCAYYAAIKV